MITSIDLKALLLENKKNKKADLTTFYVVKSAFLFNCKCLIIKLLQLNFYFK
jgi:hypothetical protein